jgi:hypothetical protein
MMARAMKSTSSTQIVEASLLVILHLFNRKVASRFRWQV